MTLPPSGVTAFTSRHGLRFRMNPANHPYHKVVAVIGGEGHCVFGQHATDLSVGHVLLARAGKTHFFADKPDAPMTLSILCLSTAAARGLPLGLWTQVEKNLTPLGRAKLEPADLALVRRQTRRIAMQASDPLPFADVISLSLASQLLARLLRGSQRDRPASGSTPLLESILWLDDHFTERITVADLAGRAALSYRNYTTAFRDHTGATVVEYITAKRLSLAKRLIEQTGDIATSAYESGFNDLSHFYRVFTRRFGRTPGQKSRPAHRNQVGDALPDA